MSEQLFNDEEPAASKCDRSEKKDSRLPDTSSAVSGAAVAQGPHLSDPPFQAIAVIGLGLIGASVCAAVHAAFPQARILGVDIDERSCNTAEEKGWLTEACLPDDSRFERFVRDICDLVIVATPVSAVDEYFAKMRDWGFSGLITDTVSTKAHILAAAERSIADAGRFIPGHPMAGSEQSGIAGARSDLFKGANWILCPDENTDPELFSRLHELICALDARVISLPREKHDAAVAVVSHVPHMVASSLVHLICRHCDDTQAVLRLAAGGFKDTTRIAAGSPELWCGIAFDNARSLADGLAEIQDIISSFASALVSGDREAFSALLAEAADLRRSLPVAWIPSTEKLLEVRIPMVNRTGVVAEVTTIASSVGCNIQSIDIDHISEGNAVLSLILTDEGDIGRLSCKLIDAGYPVSFTPLAPKEYTHVR